MRCNCEKMKGGKRLSGNISTPFCIKVLHFHCRPFKEIVTEPQRGSMFFMKVLKHTTCESCQVHTMVLCV